jgi:hypothetical protein
MVITSNLSNRGGQCLPVLKREMLISDVSEAWQEALSLPEAKLCRNA